MLDSFPLSEWLLSIFQKLLRFVFRHYIFRCVFLRFRFKALSFVKFGADVGVNVHVLEEGHNQNEDDLNWSYETSYIWKPIVERVNDSVRNKFVRMGFQYDSTQESWSVFIN